MIISPMMIPAPCSIPMPSQSTASRRAADRERKREAREAMRKAGQPDPRMLDAAIVDALAQALKVPEGKGGIRAYAYLEDVLAGALNALQGRVQDGHPLQRQAVHRAIADRLAPRTP